MDIPDQMSIESAGRQLEISEWQYNSKMETVFVMQLLFLAIVIISIVFYFNSVGILGTSFSWYVTILTALVLLLVIINRIMYSSARRDTRFWNRRRFAEDNTKTSTTSARDPYWQEFMNALQRLRDKQSGRESCPAGCVTNTNATA
jgi:hypothetical protein